MSRYAVHICNTTSGADELPRRKQTYENIKALVLAAGEFSVFEATATPHLARMFDRLCRDPELVTEQRGFPWTAVRRKEPAR